MEEFKEEWRPVVGYEGLYEVSNLGNVDSLNFHREGRRHRIKVRVNFFGYAYVMLNKDKQQRPYFLHRIIAMAFVPNPNNYPIINHKDENPLNNNIENLEWVTYKYNTNYGTCIKRRSEKKKKPVIQMTLDGEFIARYNSVKEAAANINCRPSSITCACRGRLKKCQGFLWKFEKESAMENSRWRTKEEKERDIEKKKLNALKHKKKIIQFTIDGCFIKEYGSCYEASAKTGINRRSILENCKKRRKTTHGYIFKYKEDVK